MKPVLIVIPTQAKNIEEFKSCKVYESLNNLYDHYKFISGRSLDFYIVPNNKDGLSKVYNRFITEYNKNKICVFCHDDIIIHSIDFVTWSVHGQIYLKGPAGLKIQKPPE